MDILGLMNVNTNTITKTINKNWEECLEYIKNNFNYTEIEINLGYVNSDNFDFYSILYRLNIQERFHYPLMRLNDLKSATDFSLKNNRIKIYDASSLENLYLTAIIK